MGYEIITSLFTNLRAGAAFAKRILELQTAALSDSPQEQLHDELLGLQKDVRTAFERSHW